MKKMNLKLLASTLCILIFAFCFMNVSVNAVDIEATYETGIEEVTKTTELLLGDIMISIEQAKTQAEEYNHSFEREIAFLTAHSMLHLCGYDHMEDEERVVMEQKQEEILTLLGITRE